MKLLIITNLFPNAAEPNRSPFNFQQIRELAKLCDVKVVAPIPHFQYSREQVPEYEEIAGIAVYHPRYLVIPKIMRCLYGFFFYDGIRNTVEEIYEDFEFDKILATWAYPDAFGAALIARQMDKPLYIKVHGTDINVFIQYFLRRTMITWACRQAQKIMAVSSSLKERIAGLGIPADKIELIPNGVDCDKFKILDKDECRTKLGLSHKSKHVTYIGNLKPIKGVRYLIQAFLDVMPDVCLNIVGDGKELNNLEKMAVDLQLAERVRFFGRQPHEAIPLWINASDCLCLPSLNEGCPNVVLESLACGRPVVASRVGAVPDLLDSEDKGIMVEPGNEKALARAIKQIIMHNVDRRQIRESVLGYGWEENAKRVYSIMQKGTKGKRALSLKKKVVSKVIPSGTILIKGTPGQKRIALTFDDGPGQECTPQVLDILKNENVTATFFYIGNMLEQNLTLALRAVNEGHTIGWHSYTHRGYQQWNGRQWADDLIKGKELFKNLFNKECLFFRPPRGIYSLRHILFCTTNKVTTVLWNKDSLDFKSKTSSEVLDTIESSGIEDGDIWLLHDDHKLVLEYLPKLINKCREKGLKFVSIKDYIQ